MGHLAGFLAYAAGALRWPLGIVAALLPARSWPSLDLYVPATASATLSGIITFLAAGAIGVPGFINHATDLAAAIDTIALNSPGFQAAGTGPVLTSLALYTFLLLTPAGWATMYLGATGFLRAIAPVFAEGFGDPLLTGIDRVVLWTRHAARTSRTRRQREALEGPEVPDRIVPGLKLGIPSADLVIVASRQKPGWDKGTVVLSAKKTYRVGAIEERTIAGRLRTLYPLSEHKDMEVFRRTVRYDLPD